jgi:hypothetical protein
MLIIVSIIIYVHYNDKMSPKLFKVADIRTTPFSYSYNPFLPICTTPAFLQYLAEGWIFAIAKGWIFADCKVADR